MDISQKSRIQWDIKGDENTKFFHGILNQKRRHQLVQGIMVNGEWLSNPIQVEEAFFNFFHDKFQPIESVFDSNYNPRFATLCPNVALDLQMAASSDEIRKAVWDCGSGVMPRGTNSAFITLILKVPNPLLIKDYRPISLIAFISGRKILDGPLMVSEIIDWYKKRRKNLMIFKVDFEKAFDSISWKYLDFVLAKMGFGESWRSWIRACLYSTRTLVLLNGSRTPEFSLGCGLRQGDPLSPFFFILIMEGLHLTLDVATHSQNIRGVTIESITNSLHSFYLASGLKLNISKSNLYGVGVPEDDLQDMTQVTGCQAGSFPFTYLGLPIGKNMRRKSSWITIVDRFKAKLSTWKENLLSIGGRYTLIKSVLGSLKIYYFSLFKAPKVVIHNLERLRSRFFWGGSDNINKMAWIK
ncbi:putative RNA-directed DNA polymerase, eukaryota, reverse transcriptase zinc-binding domain protein [Tanacetum coccineum]